MGVIWSRQDAGGSSRSLASSGGRRWANRWSQHRAQHPESKDGRPVQGQATGQTHDPDLGVRRRFPERRPSGAWLQAWWGGQEGRGSLPWADGAAQAKPRGRRAQGVGWRDPPAACPGHGEGSQKGFCRERRDPVWALERSPCGCTLRPHAGAWGVWPRGGQHCFFTREDPGSQTWLVCPVATASEPVHSLWVCEPSLWDRAPGFAWVLLAWAGSGLTKLLGGPWAEHFPLVLSIYFDWGKHCILWNGSKKQKSLWRRTPDDLFLFFYIRE